MLGAWCWTFKKTRIDTKKVLGFSCLLSCLLFCFPLPPLCCLPHSQALSNLRIVRIAKTSFENTVLIVLGMGLYKWLNKRPTPSFRAVKDEPCSWSRTTRMPVALVFSPWKIPTLLPFCSEFSGLQILSDVLLHLSCFDNSCFNRGSSNYKYIFYL